MKSKMKVLCCLIILLTGVIYVAVQSQKKNGTHRPSFSGEWNSKEPISMGGNIMCASNRADHMASKTMKIEELADSLTIEIPNPSPGLGPATSREKLVFDGKEREVSYGQERGKKFTARLSADGQTMIVNSTLHLMVATPYNVKVQKQGLLYVTEVWKLINDGRSISVQAKAKSNLWGGERSWQTVFDKAR